MVENDADLFCSECDYKAGRIAGLRNHKKRVHLKIRYPCDKCEYKAGAKSDLKIHTQSTHNKVKLPCNTCDKVFSRPPALILHRQKVHEGINKSVKCNVCDKVISSKSKLDRHIDIVHLKVKFKCDLCDFRGCTDSLASHVRGQHGSEKFNCHY